MKKMNELKQERKSLITDMQQLIETAETEKRAQTDEELASWNEMNERVESIDTEIKQLERQEQLYVSIVSERKKDTEEEATKRYDFGKAIREARSGKLTGLEAEMHQEAEKELSKVSGVRGNLYIPSFMINKREAETGYSKSDGSGHGHIPTAVGSMDINVPPALYSQIGATVYSNLSGTKLEIPFAKGYSAGKVSEGSSASKGRPSKRAKGSLTATRFQGYDLFSQEYMSETTVYPTMLGDMVASIDREVTKELLDEAVKANPIDDYKTTDSGSVVDYGDVLNLMAELDIEDFTQEGLVVSKEIFYELAATDKGTDTGNYIVKLEGKNKGLFHGVPTYGTSFLPVHNTNKYDLVYGDWRRSFVGFWGGVQLLVDPYSESDKGEIKVTYSRMADVAVNPYTFASIRNANLA